MSDNKKEYQPKSWIEIGGWNAQQLATNLTIRDLKHLESRELVQVIKKMRSEANRRIKEIERLEQARGYDSPALNTLRDDEGNVKRFDLPKWNYIREKQARRAEQQRLIGEYQKLKIFLTAKTSTKKGYEEWARIQDVWYKKHKVFTAAGRKAFEEWRKALERLKRALGNEHIKDEYYDAVKQEYFRIRTANPNLNLEEVVELLRRYVETQAQQDVNWAKEFEMNQTFSSGESVFDDDDEERVDSFGG